MRIGCNRIKVTFLHARKIAHGWTPSVTSCSRSCSQAALSPRLQIVARFAYRQHSAERVRPIARDRRGVRAHQSCLRVNYDYIQTRADETLLDDSGKLADLTRQSGVEV